MKAISLTVLVLLSVASFAQAQNQSDISDSSVKNGKYLSFSKKITCTTIDKKSATRCLPKQQLAWQKQEIAKWKSAVRKATDMLPREFFERVGEQSSPTLSKHNPPPPMPSLVPDFAIRGRGLGVGANE